jgi:hypothetical protein
MFQQHGSQRSGASRKNARAALLMAYDEEGAERLGLPMEYDKGMGL